MLESAPVAPDVTGADSSSGIDDLLSNAFIPSGLVLAAIERDGKPYRPRQPDSNPQTAVRDPDDFREPDWPRIKEALACIPAYDYESWVRTGMALHHETRGDSDGLATFDEWSQTSEKYDAREIKAKWRSFGRSRSARPVTIASLFEEAKEHGWNAGKAAPREPSRLRILTPSECASLPDRGYIVKGMIAPRDVVCIYGAPGAGKSLIAPHIGYAVAQGREAFGMRTRPGPVLYVAAEDPHGMAGRVRALNRRHGEAENFNLVDGVSDLLCESSPDLAALRQLVADYRPHLVVIDTLAMAFPGLEENDASAMGRVVKIARSLTVTGAAVALVHHDTKAGTPTPRGHSLLNGALDAALQLLAREEDGIIRGRLSKNRNGTTDRDIAFRISVETFGTDSDGDEITAPLVAEMQPGEAPARRDRMKPAEQAALNRLHAMLADCERVTEDEFREACIEDRKVSASPIRDNRRRTTSRAITELVRRELIVLADGFVSLPNDGFDVWDGANETP